MWLAIWYVVVSSMAFGFAIDRMGSAIKEVAALNFPCARHDCGCTTVEECRKRCSCHPSLVPVESSNHCHEGPTLPVAVRVSYWSKARCQGHQALDASSLLKLDPHAFESQYAGHMQMVAIGMVVEVPDSHYPPHRRLPDKIPI
jgi:hypothetical protein